MRRPRTPEAAVICFTVLSLATAGAAAAQQDPFACTEYTPFVDTGIDDNGGDSCGWNERLPAASYPPDILAAGGAEVLDEYLAARIAQLERRSPQFRAAMTLARNGRIPVVIGTPPQVQRRVAHRFSLGERAAQGYLAEFLVRRVARESPKIDLIVIRISLEDLRRVPWWRRVLGAERVQRWIDDATDTILIHEIWGHLTPVLEAGDYTGNCPDPAPPQRVADACVMKRENVLRRELGLKPRDDYAVRVR